MSSRQRLLRVLTFLCSATLALSTACRKDQKGSFTDHPRLTPKVTLQDLTFHSSSLDRDMQYRVIAPVGIPPGLKLPVVYLLHGGGGGFRDWSNYTDVARFAQKGLLLVMPEGDESYYTNSAEHPEPIRGLRSEGPSYRCRESVAGRLNSLGTGHRRRVDGWLRGSQAVFSSP